MQWKKTDPAKPPVQGARGAAASPSRPGAGSARSKEPAPEEWTCKVPPDARFTLKATIKGDGRWTWEVFSGDTEAPMAAGNVTTLGAAKNAAELFLKRAGHT